MMPTKLNLIVAICRNNNGIGFKNTLPWKLYGDMKFFKETTTGTSSKKNVVLMGKKHLGVHPY